MQQKVPIFFAERELKCAVVVEVAAAGSDVEVSLRSVTVAPLVAIPVREREREREVVEFSFGWRSRQRILSLVGVKIMEFFNKNTKNIYIYPKKLWNFSKQRVF